MNTQIQQLKLEAQAELTHNILPFWMNQMRDHERGGFYGQITGEGRLMKEAPKGAILNARILWIFSAAYRTLGTPAYLETASQAKRYLLDHFYDEEREGIYWEVDCEGNPTHTKKQIYALGFAIYGIERILDPETHHLNLFFDEEWQHKHTIYSFGHDIEASWLLHEATLVLGDADLLAKVEPIIQQIAVAAEEGQLANGGMIYEYVPKSRHTDSELHWWVQAEMANDTGASI